MKLKSPLAIILLFILAVFTFGLIHDRRISDGFATIQPNVTEDTIRNLLGKPSLVDPSCAAYGTQLMENCSHVLVYKSAFSPLKSTYWLVFIDASGLTKATSRQSKP